MWPTRSGSTVLPARRPPTLGKQMAVASSFLLDMSNYAVLLGHSVCLLSACSHPTSGASMADILSVLFFEYLRIDRECLPGRCAEPHHMRCVVHAVCVVVVMYGTRRVSPATPESPRLALLVPASPADVARFWEGWL